MQNKYCLQCKNPFTVTLQDETFYKSFDVPNPQLCPDCRLQRRFAFRNERSLYNSTCASCQRGIVTIYAPDKGFIVVCPDCWWGNKYDALQFGRDFDFSKSLNEQLIELYRAVPHVALYTTNCVNSEYNNFGLNLNNCYLIFGGSNNENCLYGKFVLGSIDTVDALSVFSNELCYESVASERCYNCQYITNSRDCSQCLMVEDCQACTDCIGCFGLYAKQYYVFNKFVGEAEYKKIRTTYQPLTPDKIKELQIKFNDLRKTLPHRASHIYASEDCSGDLILNSTNCHDCFDIKECENCRYVSNAPKAKDSYDMVFCSPWPNEHCYNTCSSTGVRDSLADFMVWNSSNVAYSLECHQSHDLFGCISLQKQQWCILNKQYSEADYKVLRAKIIEHMKRGLARAIPSGAEETPREWGEYLQPTLSPFGYNETIAQEYYPLTKPQAIAAGYTWYDIPEKQYQVATADVLACVNCQKNYRLVKAEIDFYAKAKLPVPQLCPDCRRTRRIVERGPYHLWTRTCSKCNNTIQTNYSPERAAIVYCEQCYQAETY